LVSNNHKRIAVAAASALAASLPSQVQAQDEDYRTIVTIMRACSTIADVPARVACYDNNIRPGAPPVAAAAPGASGPAPAPAARQAEAAPRAPTGFGAASLPQTSLAREQAEEKEV